MKSIFVREKLATPKIIVQKEIRTFSCWRLPSLDAGRAR